jgi:hypothetical protein
MGGKTGGAHLIYSDDNSEYLLGHGLASGRGMKKSRIVASAWLYLLVVIGQFPYVKDRKKRDPWAQRVCSSSIYSLATLHAKGTTYY